MNRDPLGPRAIRWWVAFYTQGLPLEAAERRRMEIESDLFEHLQSLGPRGIISRSVRGMTADVWWRIRTLRTSADRAERSLAMTSNPNRRLWVVLVIVHVVFQSFSGVFTLFGVTDDGSASIGALLAGVGFAGTAVMLIGLALQSRSMVAGSWLVTLGLLPTLVSITAVIVLVAGLWTANLVYTERTVQLGWDAVSAQRSEAMASKWWWWLAIAVVPFGTGWIGLGVDNWYIWFGSWLLSGLLAAIGLVSGAAVFWSRHRTRAA